LIEILILAIIQGVTEWLPISSSGHLALAQKYMGLSLPVIFDVVLHMGSLFVVIIAMRREALEILRAVAHLDFRSQQGRLAWLVVLGSIPTAIIGFVFKSTLESLFSNATAIGIALLVTGVVLYASKQRHNQTTSLESLDAVLIGVAQGVALIPGISRSGMTISTGLLRRLDKQTTFAYSFLLFIPAVIGATVLTAGEARNLNAADVDYAAMALGVITTVIVGYISLRWLRTMVLKGRLHLFAYYCWALGFVVLLAQFM
jgi:undecaprenyl-diphosphatase